MWVLKGPKGEIYYLIPGKEHIVSRKDGDIILADDQSISRKHAILSVSHPSENWNDPEKLPVVSITETGSKYGTVINPASEAEKMEKNSTRILSDGDFVQFGLQWNVWRLVHERIVVVMSALAGSQKKEVRDIIGKLGGHIVSCWKASCTHLTMSSFTMTVKAIIALAYGKAIVIPEFWKKFMIAVQNKTELPRYEDFLPPLAETIINKNEVSFLIKPERRWLFQGKEFLFFTVQQHADHACLVTAAGGTANILDLSRLPKEKLIEPHVVVMQHLSNPSCQASQTPHAFMDVISFLQSHGKRVIPVSEIGLAILHCSTEKYCNPSFNFALTILSSNRNSVPDLASQQTLAIETQESDTCQRSKRHSLKENVIIPESGTVSKYTSSSSTKEGSDATLLADLQHSSEEKHVEKTKVCSLQVSSLGSRSGSQKRVRESEDAGIGWPSKRTASCQPKAFGQKFRSKVDEDDVDAEGLFDFVSDETRISTRDEDDMFAFKRSATDKVEASKHEEDMFSFQTTQNIEKEGMIPLSLNATQPMSNIKRKLSLSEENLLPDKLYKKMALEDSSENTFKDEDNDFQDVPGNFISASKIKREDCNEHPLSDGTHNFNSTVVVKPLLTMQSPTSYIKTKDESMGLNTKNFKKFQKVQAPSVSLLPRIISGRDLVPYIKNMSATVCRLFNNDNDEAEEKDDQDDWAFQTVSQTKRKGHSRRL